MKKAKNKIEFEELLKKLLEKLKSEGEEFMQEIDFDKIWLLIEKRLNIF